MSRMPPAIWVLGFVSMLMDISSEMVHSLLPMFLVGTLGVSVVVVGLIEGIAESTALVTKVFSGALSDHLGRRKALAVVGYAMGAFTKPVFAFAHGAEAVAAARFIDRVGKGVRGAPRDALVADIAPVDARGAAYGLRQSLDTVGAFVGPLLASGLMVVFANDFRLVFWLAVVPGMVAVALLMFGVKEPGRAPHARTATPIRIEVLARLTGAYWSVVAVGAGFALARFSEAFLVLRAEQVGVPVPWVPLIMALMNLVYSATAYPFGKFADSMSHAKLLAMGLASLVASDVALAAAGDWSLLLVGIALWGLHMGMTQGLLAAMVADTAPQDLRGTAFGFFNLVSGIAMLAASAIAGLLWDRLGSSATFIAGASFATVTLVALAVVVRVRPAKAAGSR